MSAPTWLAGPGASFEEALAVGGDVRAALVAAAPRLPRKDLGRLYPATMQDAVAVVHARLEENKKKAAASKQKSKSKPGAPHSPSDSHFPGARPGGGDPSAFWLYIEVRAGRGREQGGAAEWPCRTGRRPAARPRAEHCRRPSGLLNHPPAPLTRCPHPRLAAGLLPRFQPGRSAGAAAADPRPPGRPRPQGGCWLVG